MTGQVSCLGGIEIEVVKEFAIRTNRRGQMEIRGEDYAYHVHVPGRGDLLRYDNSHDLDKFHRHEFEFGTRRQKPLQYLSREEFPTLIEVIDEVQALAGRLGLVP